MNPFTTAAALEQTQPDPQALLPDYRMADEAATLRLPTISSGTVGAVKSGHRNHSPWNHTYTEIPDGGLQARAIEVGTDPVYEEIEREGRSEIQVSDLSDEDGRRQNSDISRQSSRSYGDHRPLLPYALPDRSVHQNAIASHCDPRFKTKSRPQEGFHLPLTDSQVLPPGMMAHQLVEHTMVSPGHLVPMAHPIVTSAHALPHSNGHIGVPSHYSEAVLTALGQHGPVVQPLSEPNLRSWEAVQRHRDLQTLHQLGEMTVAVLNGEQVVCKLKSPLAPIHENSSAVVANGVGVGVGAMVAADHFVGPPAYSHC